MNRYEQLEAELHKLENPTQALVHQVGSSVQGRTIWSVSFGPGPRRVLMTGGVHAREWVASDFLLEVIKRFAQQGFPYQGLQLIIVPMVNPDGMVVAETQLDRAHKERQKSNSNGVDLNRNFDALWDRAGTDPEPDFTDGNYPGGAPFSEPETEALRNLVAETAPEVLIDWHCRGGLIDGFGPVGPQLARLMAIENEYKIVQKMHYEISGTISQWFRTLGADRSAVNVEIATEADPDLEKNWRALTAALKYLDETADAG